MATEVKVRLFRKEYQPGSRVATLVWRTECGGTVSTVTTVEHALSLSIGHEDVLTKVAPVQGGGAL